MQNLVLLLLLYRQALASLLTVLPYKYDDYFTAVLLCVI